MQLTKHNIPGGIFLAFLIFQLTMSTFCHTTGYENKNYLKELIKSMWKGGSVDKVFREIE